MADTHTLTLSDFLLARIAEDEENVRDDWAAGYGGLHIISVPMHERMLAECEAKRRIVEGFTFEDSDESAVDSWMAQEGLTPPDGIRNLIYVGKCLALPYRDHPDYREEWRP